MWKSSFLAIIACCFIMITAPAAPDDKAPDKKPAEKYVKLVHTDTGKVLSIADNSEADEAKAVLAKDDGSQSSHWKIVKDGEHLKLVNRKSEKVLDVKDQSKDEDGQIVQWEDKSNDNDNQRWSWVGDEKEKSRRLKSKWSELVLDVGDGGTIVQKKADEKAKTQLWKVVEVKE